MDVQELTPAPMVRGNGKVELLDDRGKVLERVPFENVLAWPGRDYLKYMVRRAFRAPVIGETLVEQSTNSQEWYSAARSAEYTKPLADPDPVFPFAAIFLTDDTATPTSSAVVMRGKPIGWASRKLYSGADVMRGTPNPVETTYTTTRTRFVFDWPTHAAIGTIRAIGWSGVDDAVSVVLPADTIKLRAENAATSDTPRGLGGVDNTDYTNPVLLSVNVATSGGSPLIVRAVPGLQSPPIDWSTFSAITFPSTGLTRVAGLAVTPNYIFATGYAGRDVKVFAKPSSWVTQTLPAASETIVMPSDGIATTSTYTGKALVWAVDSVYYAANVGGGVCRLYRIPSGVGATRTITSVDYQLPGTSYPTGLAYDYNSSRQELAILSIGSTSQAYITTIGRVSGLITSQRAISYSNIGSNAAGLHQIFGLGSGGLGQAIHAGSEILSSEPYSLGTWTKLLTPLVKGATQNLKLTYDIGHLEN